MDPRSGPVSLSKLLVGLNLKMFEGLHQAPWIQKGIVDERHIRGPRGSDDRATRSQKDLGRTRMKTMAAMRTAVVVVVVLVVTVVVISSSN